MNQINLKTMTWEDLAQQIVKMGDLIRDQRDLIEKQTKMMDAQDKLAENKLEIIKELRGNNRLLLDMLKAKESE